MKKEIFLSVIIPCYNEEENLKKGVLKNVYKYLSERKYTWEVIISDDGSTDNSRELIKEEIKKLRNIFLLENPHGGKPSALLYGIRKAKGKYVLFADMDQSTPIMELSKLIPFVNGGAGAVIGSRGLARKNFPFYRRLGAIVFITFRKIHPFTFSFFRKNEKVKGWKVTSFDVELLHLVSKMGYVIEEVPVFWDNSDESTSKGGGLNRYIKESKEMLFQIIRVKLNDIKGTYDGK